MSLASGLDDMPRLPAVAAGGIGEQNGLLPPMVREVNMVQRGIFT